MSVDDHKLSQLLTLTVQQQNAVDHIILGLSDREVAEKVGVTRETVTRWRNHHPALQAELNRRRAELARSSQERMRLLLPEAVEALRNIVNDSDNPNRWRAALEVLKLVGPPENLFAEGPQTAEGLIKSRADGRKLMSFFQLDEAEDDEVLAMMEELAEVLGAEDQK